MNDIVSKLKTFKRIAIVGKGSSLSRIHEPALHDAFIINLNDSERYISGHVTLFHADWVIESLKHEGFKNEFYFSPHNISILLPSKATYVPVKYQANNQEGIEHLAAGFKRNEFVLSDFLLLSALQLVYLINETNLPVYLLGFDFALQEGLEAGDMSGHDANYKRILLRTQKENFRYVKKYITEVLHMKVLHVGETDLSDLTIDTFNEAIQEEIPSHFDLKASYKQLLAACEQEDYTLVVAELTNNHIGDPQRLRQMIRAAKKCGADMIKVQKRDVDSFYTQEELNAYYESPFGKTLGDYRRGVELNDALMKVLIEECCVNQIVWFASVLDYPSLKYMEKYDCPLIKLPSTISNHKNFLRKAAEEYPGDLVISTGFTDSSYEDFVLETFSGNRTIFLLQCTSSYPAPPEACQIAVVRHYEELRVSKQIQGLYAGYSSHDLGSLGCMLAVAAGARMVEKHVKYGNLDWIHFDGVALDLSTQEFELFVKDIRKAQRMCGSKQKMIHQTEHHKYAPNDKHN